MLYVFRLKVYINIQIVKKNTDWIVKGCFENHKMCVWYDNI